MKKGLLFSVIIIVALLTHSVTLGEDSIKVGLIDIQRCLDESEEGRKVLELLKKKKAALQRQLDTKQTNTRPATRFRDIVNRLKCWR